MKLFMKTAGLCIIPKLVNAAEAQLTKLMTPDLPSDKQLERVSRERMEDALAARQKEEEYSPPFIEAKSGKDFDYLRQLDESKGQLDLAPGNYKPEVTKEGVIVPQANKVGTAYGTGSTVKEHDQAMNYTNFVHKPQTQAELALASAPKKRYTRCMMPITKEVHDKVNEIHLRMQKENMLAGTDEHGAYPYCREDAAKETNEFFDADWGVSTITRCLRKPGTKTRIERDDCPSQAEVDGDVIGSVSKFSDMDKLNIQTK